MRIRHQLAALVRRGERTTTCRAGAVAEDPAAELHSSGPTLTSIFPMFSPRSRPRNVRGVFDPVADRSRYCSRPSRTHRRLLRELAEAVEVVGNDVALDAKALGDDEETCSRTRRRLGVVVARDRAAGGNSTVVAGARRSRPRGGLAEGVEVEVDAVGAPSARARRGLHSLVDRRGVEPSSLEPRELLARAGASDHRHPAIRAICPAAPPTAPRAENEDGLTLLRLAENEEAIPRGQAGHSRTPSAVETGATDGSSRRSDAPSDSDH